MMVLVQAKVGSLPKVSQKPNGTCNTNNQPISNSGRVKVTIGSKADNLPSGMEDSVATWTGGQQHWKQS
jgi:hypothetical protein